MQTKKSKKSSKKTFFLYVTLVVLIGFFWYEANHFHKKLVSKVTDVTDVSESPKPLVNYPTPTVYPNSFGMRFNPEVLPQDQSILSKFIIKDGKFYFNFYDKLATTPEEFAAQNQFMSLGSINEKDLTLKIDHTFPLPKGYSTFQYIIQPTAIYALGYQRLSPYTVDREITKLAENGDIFLLNTSSLSDKTSWQKLPNQITIPTKDLYDEDGQTFVTHSTSKYVYIISWLNEKNFQAYKAPILPDKTIGTWSKAGTIERGMDEGMPYRQAIFMDKVMYHAMNDSVDTYLISGDGNLTKMTSKKIAVRNPGGTFVDGTNLYSVVYQNGKIKIYKADLKDEIIDFKWIKEFDNPTLSEVTLSSVNDGKLYSLVYYSPDGSKSSKTGLIVIDLNE